MIQNSTTPAPKKRGRPFQPGADPRRHQLTPAECRDGFYSALASVTDRFGEDAARNFLKAKLGASYDPRQRAGYRERREGN